MVEQIKEPLSKDEIGKPQYTQLRSCLQLKLRAAALQHSQL